MLVTENDILEFIHELTNTDRRSGSSADVFAAFGVEGDDAAEFMEAYSEKFSVNLDAYLWYFHHGDEGSGNIGGLFFKPPYARVDRMPITIDMLTTSANKGSWDVRYPEHSVPGRRYDILISQAVLIAAGASLFIWLIFKLA